MTETDRYWCTRCEKHHRVGSKRGIAHAEFAGERPERPSVFDSDVMEEFIDSVNEPEPEYTPEYLVSVIENPDSTLEEKFQAQTHLTNYNLEVYQKTLLGIINQLDAVTAQLNTVSKRASPGLPVAPSQPGGGGPQQQQQALMGLLLAKAPDILDRVLAIGTKWATGGGSLLDTIEGDVREEVAGHLREYAANQAALSGIVLKKLMAGEVAFIDAENVEG